MTARSPGSFEPLFQDMEKISVEINDTFPPVALEQLKILAQRRSSPPFYFTTTTAALFANAMADSSIEVKKDYHEVPVIWSLNLGNQMSEEKDYIMLLKF